MADNKIDLIARLNVEDSAKKINQTDIPKLQKKIEGIKIKCKLDTDSITSIQSQLANVGKNLKIEVPKINTDINTENINKKTGSIATVYAEGARQSEILHLKQERLQQDYDILTAKIQKTKLALDSLATRNGVNYNEVFTSIMSKDIVDEASLNRAKDALSAIRKEFQLANAQMTSDIPQNVIENFIQRIAKADSQIKILTVDYQKLNSVPQTLKDSFQELQNLASGFDFSTDFQGESKESINEKIQAYTKIKVALNETQALLKVAQKEEATFNKEFERELKIEERINKEKEKTFNKEFEQALKEEQRQLAVEQKRVEVAKQLREEQQHDYWQSRFEESVKGMTAENQVLKDMKKYYEDLNKAQKEVERQEKKTFQENNQLANLQNRIKRLTADVNAYASANKRATESTKQMTSGKSFADEWARIATTMAKGAELTDRELKDLSTDIAVFKKEAKSAGLEGASAFEKFGNAFKTISTYISANQIINMVISQIRSAVTELQTVDDRLTEISKTSDRTVESLRSLGETAFDTASKYGRTASDYLLGVQEMSRAGFNEQQSEAMAELTILAQAAGDMTADLANQYLIATNAAYDYNGSIAELTDTLDRQNYVTNHYALSMNDLAEATKIAASQAAQSGIGIDEMTAALSTMIATTQQGGEIAARSLRGKRALCTTALYRCESIIA